jgi:hypothetical protein
MHARHRESEQSTLSVDQHPLRRAICTDHRCQSPERERSLSSIKATFRGSGLSRGAAVPFRHLADEDFTCTCSQLHRECFTSTPDPNLRVELREEQRPATVSDCQNTGKTGRPRKSSQINSLFESQSTHICPLFLILKTKCSFLALFWATRWEKHVLWSPSAVMTVITVEARRPKSQLGDLQSCCEMTAEVL